VVEETDEQKEAKVSAILDAIGKSKDYGELVGFYVDYRDAKEQIKKEMTERIAGVEVFMDRIEGRLLEMLMESGQDSAKTPYGTAYKSTKTSAKVADWNVLIGYIKKNDAYDLLTKNVSKDAIKARMEDTGEIVPGVNLTTYQEVGIRRA
jgi:hypothetical protein